MSTAPHTDDAPPASIRVEERSYVAEPAVHRHRYYQLIFPHRGALRMNVAGGRVALGPAEWGLIAPGAEHVYWADEPTYVLVADLAAHTIAAPPGPADATGLLRLQLDRRLATLAGLLQSELRAGALDEPLVAEALAGYVGAAVMVAARPAAASAPERPAPELARRARDLLEAQALGPVRLEEVAAAAGASLAHLQRSFRAAYGVSMVAYVQTLRLRRAQALLLEGDAPIEAVAAAVGLASASYFTRLFTREVGVSPAAFRRQGRGAGSGRRSA